MNFQIWCEMLQNVKTHEIFELRLYIFYYVLYIDVFFTPTTFVSDFGILISQIYGNPLFLLWIFHPSPQTLGNGNNHQATITSLDIYNARFIRIRPIAGNTKTFCLRIELCGKGKKFLKIQFVLLYWYYKY